HSSEIIGVVDGSFGIVYRPEIGSELAAAEVRPVIALPTIDPTAELVAVLGHVVRRVCLYRHIGPDDICHLTKPKRVPLGSVLLFVGKVSTPSTRPGLGRGRRRYVIHFIADYREVPDRLQHHDGTYHPAEFRFPEDRLQHTTGSRGRHYRITHSLH